MAKLSERVRLLKGQKQFGEDGRMSPSVLYDLEVGISEA